MSFFDLFEIKCHLLNTTWWKSATLSDVYEELDRVIDINVSDRKGLTPIYHALMVKAYLYPLTNLYTHQKFLFPDYEKQKLFNVAQIVKVLINAGADVNVRDKSSGIMPLMIASSFYMGSDTAQPLIDAGAFVNARDRQDGMTPLFFGILKNPNSPEIVQSLIDAGADVNFTTKKGLSPLMVAVNTMNFQMDTVDILLEAGADPSLRDEDGRTALSYAEDNENIRFCLHELREKLLG